MDGSIRLACYSAGFGGLTGKLLKTSSELKHAKYVKAVVWSPTSPVLATASADGTVTLSKVSNLSEEDGTVTVDTFETLHMSGTVESLCFSLDGKSLICYTRDTPYLSFFDLDDGCKQTKVNLNRTGGAAVGGFEDHVSFAVMDMAVSPNGKYIALATDTSRNIVVDASNGKQIRNLYGAFLWIRYSAYTLCDIVCSVLYWSCIRSTAQLCYYRFLLHCIALSVSSCSTTRYFHFPFL